MLEHELAATRESLQATIEELETSNEELQATNEEMMASNEELQSSNEELQSVNEELNTVNAEYQEKIDILNRLNADLDSLARVASSGTVFVDEQMHLTRFSPEAAQIFRLRDSDIGRPLEDLNHTLNYPGFMQDLGTTLRTAQPIEELVTDSQNRHFLVKMLPYRIPSSAARGVVVSFVDMTSVNDLARMQAILDALAEHVAVLDTQGTITMVNRAWRNFAAENGDPACSTCGTGINYLLTCQRAIGKDCGYAERAAKGLRDILDGLTTHFSMEYPCHGREQERWFVMHISPLMYLDTPANPRAQSGIQALRGVVISHVNITEWRNGGNASKNDSSEEV